MENKTVQIDSHGPYIRTNGQVYRPQCSKNACGNKKEYMFGWAKQTFVDGEKVKAGMISCTPLAKIVKSNGIYDIWYTHGEHYDLSSGKFKLKQSDVVWNPAEE